MNEAQLLEFALQNAKFQSITNPRFIGQKVYVLFNGESEYTLVAEKDLKDWNEIEPGLSYVTCFKDGVRLEGSERPPKA